MSDWLRRKISKPSKVEEQIDVVDDVCEEEEIKEILNTVKFTTAKDIEAQMREFMKPFNLNIDDAETTSAIMINRKVDPIPYNKGLLFIIHQCLESKDTKKDDEGNILRLAEDFSKFNLEHKKVVTAMMLAYTSVSSILTARKDRKSIASYLTEELSECKTENDIKIYVRMFESKMKEMNLLG